MKTMRKTNFGRMLFMALPLLCCPFATHRIYANTIAVVQAENSTIKGKVIDSQTGEPLTGAYITVNGTKKVAVTNLDGEFTIDAKPGDELVVTSLGYEKMQVRATNNLTVSLTATATMLSETVVVGYNTQKRNSLTGSMQSIGSKELTNITTPNVTNMLTGKVPGMNVMPGSGKPGSFGAIIVRGKSTINGSTAPLWVIDGVIVGKDPGDINPNDIETLTVLKDAASTAIYGSQGANGVIVVTTKGAQAGKTTINFSAKAGISTLNNGNVKMMNGAELYDYYKSFSNVAEISFPRWNEKLRDSNFDWWKLATHTGNVQNYDLTINSGGEKLSAVFTGGVYKENGAVRGYDYTRYNTMVKLNFRPYSWIAIRPAINGSKGAIDDRQRSTYSMYSMLPWDNPYDTNGKIVGNKSSSWVNSNSTNYLYELQYNWSKYDSYSFNGNFDFDLYLTDWLTFSSVNSYRWSTHLDKSYVDPRTSGAEGKGRVSESTSTNTRRYTSQLLKATRNFGKYHGFLMLGYEFNDGEYRFHSSDGTGLVPGYAQLDITSTPEAVNGNKYEWAVQSFFANLNTDYADKYLLQLSLRTDGASNFGSNAAYGTFFSVSGGWVATAEEWFKVPYVDYLKVRASFGSVGSRPNSLYPQYGLYSLRASYNEVPGAVISQLANKELTWEKSYTTGVGLDLNMFHRLRMTFDFYHKRTSNLLFAVPISGVMGVTSIWQNIGELTNTGFETTLSADIIKNKDLTWTFDANLSTNSNKIKKLYSGRNQIIEGDGIAGSTNTLLRPGLSADTYYLREWAGVNPETGAPQWLTTDANGNRVITNNYAKADQVALDKRATPSVFGSFSTTLAYKGFDLNAVFGYSLGAYIYNYSRQEYDSDGAYTDRNQFRLQKGWSRWQKKGDNATHPVAAYNNPSNSNKASTRYLENADFLKLRSVTLGYNFDLKSQIVKALRVYLSGENLFCITGYSGVDPELPAADNGRDASGERSTALSISTGAGVYPSVRKFMLGVNVTF
ncbi:MAG: SusC/RagA family TonB-linked outer membrane protein [Prevotella sp.]|jgi:tonB-linked outer membrane protein, susC/ragA family|nr:MAG: SusC/RagA family TonB-linked outer membrane protein [Prevotella sp.]